MPRPSLRSRRASVRLRILFLPLLLGPAVLPWTAGAQAPAVGALAEEAEPPWPRELVETFRVFFERVDVEALLDGVVAPPPAAVPTLATLADRLPRTAEAPFRYVQDRVSFEPYAGSVRGAGGTLAARAGNSVDQALLLAELYRRQGRRARLVRGSLRWREAVALVGASRTGLPQPGDPWLRRVEAASEHWWVELQDSGGWLALDPVFPTTEPGEEVARRRDVLDELPLEQRAGARLRIRRGEEELARIALPLSEMIGATLRVDSVAPDGVAPDDVAPDGQPADSPVDPVAPDDAGGAEPDPALEPDAASIIADMLPAPGDAVRSLRLAVGGREQRSRPLAAEERTTLTLEIDVELPVGSGLSMRLPLGGDPRSSVRVAFGSGSVDSTRVAALAEPIHDRYRALAGAEIDTLLAWQNRPDEVADPDVPLAPLPPPPWPLLAADGESVHPTLRLVEEALSAWRTLDDHGMEMLAWVVLAATERVPLPVATTRDPLRVAAVRWDPPTETGEGAITVWTSDRLAVVGGDEADRAGFLAAYGMLQSAVVGQVLNRIADRPPVTAFDVTLRAVGTGGRLGWWGNDPSPDLPAAAKPVAEMDLSAGRWLAGTTGARTGVAWWATVPRTGLTHSRVVTDIGVAQASVSFGEAVDLASLESLLAGLHDLHHALRWLIGIADPQAASLADLVPGACAGAPLVRELMRAGAPAEAVPPAFEMLCRLQP